MPAQYKFKIMLFQHNKCWNFYIISWIWEKHESQHRNLCVNKIKNSHTRLFVVYANDADVCECVAFVVKYKMNALHCTIIIYSWKD